jgi:NAD(P)-dependent dehydrogenase (short-subunit alcohol dehydrogenase family)
LIRKSAPVRIVNVASAGQQPIDFSDVMLTRGYDGVRAYCQSKLALVMFTFDLAESLKGSGVTVNCLAPGDKTPGDSIILEGKMLSGQISTGTLARATYPDADVYDDGYLYIEYDKFYVACNNRPLYHLGRMQMLVLFRLAHAGGRPVARLKIWADV